MRFTKRLLCVAIALATALSVAPAIPAHAETGSVIPIYIDGQRAAFQSQEPVIINGRVLVPVELFEMLGLSIEWLRDDETAVLIYDIWDEIIVSAEDSFFTINGKRIYPDVPQRLINGQLMLPLRAVMEAFVWGHEPPEHNIEEIRMLMTAAGEFPFWRDDETGAIHLWSWWTDSAPSVPVIFERGGPILVFIDGRQVALESQEPVIVNGRILVPVELFEMLGVGTTWLCDKGTSALIYSHMGEIIVHAGDLFLTVNNERVYQDVPHQLIDGELMLPLSAVMDALMWGAELPHYINEIRAVKMAAGEFSFWWFWEDRELHFNSYWHGARQQPTPAPRTPAGDPLETVQSICFLEKKCPSCATSDKGL